MQVDKADVDVEAVVVKGAEIPDMSEDDWKVLISKQEIVFARTSPEQKLIIVKVKKIQFLRFHLFLFWFHLSIYMLLLRFYESEELNNIFSEHPSVFKNEITNTVM